MKTLMTISAAGLLAALGGCGWSIGASSQEQVHKQTLGQQLIDLKKARDTGAVTDEEYAKKRKVLIDAALASP